MAYFIHRHLDFAKKLFAYYHTKVLGVFCVWYLLAQNLVLRMPIPGSACGEVKKEGWYKGFF